VDLADPGKHRRCRLAGGLLTAAAIVLAGLLMLQAVSAAEPVPVAAVPADPVAPLGWSTEAISRPVSLLARSMPSVTVRGPAPLPGWVADALAMLDST